MGYLPPYQFVLNDCKQLSEKNLKCMSKFESI